MLLRTKVLISVSIIITVILMSSVISSAATITYTYDSLNRITKVEHENGVIEEFTYDSAGNRLTLALTGTEAMLLGDINGDDIVDISDVILVLRIALGLDQDPGCSDINNDGSVDISDVILTLRMALGLDPLQECTE